MADLKEPLLQRSSVAVSREPARRSNFPSTRSPFQVDVLGVKKRGQGVRTWIRIDKNGTTQALEVDKVTIMKRCDLPARDLRLLDPLFVYPSTILGREKAIVVNLEQIRCIITADEVLLLNSLDDYVLQYVEELQRRLHVGSEPVNNEWCHGGQGSSRFSLQTFGYKYRTDSRFVIAQDNKSNVANDFEVYSGSSVDDLPFEFRALEVALESACTFLDTQATELEIEAYPVLDELTSKISTLNLERVRRLKSRLVALTRRVQKVRDEIEQLMDDDGDMAEMYLTEKKERMESLLTKDQSTYGYNNLGGGGSISAPVTPVGSPVDSRKLEKSLSFARSVKDSEYNDEHIQELEMLLEAYFVVIDSTLNKLTSLKEYIDDTEDFINIQLDNVRNQLIQFELLLTTATFVVAIFGVVAGVFGMNIPIDMFEEPWTFKWVLLVTGACGLTVFCSFLWYFRHRRLIPL